MSEWESARGPSRRGRGAVLAVVVAVAFATIGAVAVRDRRTRPTRLQVADDATQEAQEVSDPDGFRWPRPQPGLWRFMPDGPLIPRVGHAMVWTGGGVFVWGGFTVTGVPLADGALFDPADGTWTRLPPVGGDNSTAAYATTSGAEAVIVSTAATYAFDPSSQAWRTFPAPPLPDRHALTDQVVGTADGVVVLSRPIGTDVGPRPAVLILRRDEQVWRRLPDPPVRFSDGDLLLADGARLVIHTRAVAAQPPAAVELDLRRDDLRWSNVDVPPGLADHPLTRLLGGLDGDRTVLVGIGVSDGPGYAAVNDGGQWRRTESPPLPASLQVDGLWAGDGLIVWNRITGAGAHLNLRSARWTRFAASPVADGTPRPAAWTGSTIVTWGGFDPAGAVYRVR